MTAIRTARSTRSRGRITRSGGSRRSGANEEATSESGAGERKQFCRPWIQERRRGTDQGEPDGVDRQSGQEAAVQEPERGRSRTGRRSAEGIEPPARPFRRVLRGASPELSDPTRLRRKDRSC